MAQERRSPEPPTEETREPQKASQEPLCAACGAILQASRCKLRCRCGFFEDCGDVMLPQILKKGDETS